MPSWRCTPLSSSVAVPTSPGDGATSRCGSAAATSAPTVRCSSLPITTAWKERSPTWWRSSNATTSPCSPMPPSLTRNVTVPVSAGLLTDTNAYFAALTRYRAGDLTPIIEQFSRAAFAAIGNGRRLVDDLHAVRSGWEERLRVRRDATAWRVADLLLQRPVVSAAVVASELGIAPQNTYRSLRPLLDAGIAVEFTDKKRNQLWRAPDVLDALDRFATRAGRRNRPTQ